MVYDVLRKLAAAKLALEQPGQTLQATALVHEAYLRLVGNHPIPTRYPSPPPLGRRSGVRGDNGTAAATSSPPLSAASSEAVSVDYATSNGTAKSGSDYQPRSGTILNDD